MYGSALTFPLKPGFCGRVYQFYKSRQIEHIKTSANSAVKQAHVGTTTHISHTLYAIAGNAPVYVSACLFFSASVSPCLSVSVALYFSCLNIYLPESLTLSSVSLCRFTSIFVSIHRLSIEWWWTKKDAEQWPSNWGLDPTPYCPQSNRGYTGRYG